MTDRIVVTKASPSTTFVLEADLISQSVAGNSSVVRCYLRAINAGNTTSQFLNAGVQSGAIDGLGEFGRHSAQPFLPAGVGNNVTRWRDGPWDVTVPHANNGTATITFRMALAYGNIAETHTANLTLPNIPRMPGQPAWISATGIGATSISLAWGAAAAGGSAITNYQVQHATNDAFTTGTGLTDFGALTAGTVEGLPAGAGHWFRVRALNAQGYGPWSAVTTARPVLPAPAFNSWAQNAVGDLVASWEPPSIAAGVTGYRLQIARDPGFTAGVQFIDLGNVTTHAVANLSGGRNYSARIAARTAGGVNEYSSTRSTMLVLDPGDLDGWTRVGVKPAEISYFTNEGIRRGVIAGRQSLILESLSTGPATLPADTFGIQRTVAGLTQGKAYRFEASAILTGAAIGTTYRLRVLAEGQAAPVEITTDLTGLGYIEFIADATSAVIQIMLAQPLAIAGAIEEVERVGFSTLRLLELGTDYPVRLRETVYESNLANHFDLACNSVGATWYVGKDGVTRFRLPGTALPVSAVFTDQADDSALHYIDVNAAYDTRGMVNRLDVTNYGVDDARENEENDDLIVTSPASITAYGVRSARLETNLWGEPPYDESLNDRLSNLLDAADEPRLFIAGFRWNAQENIAAANALDVGQRVLVAFNGTEQDSQIISIQHDIAPRRWIVTIALQRL